MINDKPEDLCLDRPVDEIWVQALEILSKRIPTASYAGWVLPTQLIALSSNEAELAVANEFARSRILNNHGCDIEQVLTELLGREISLKVSIEPVSAARTSGYTPSIASITVMPGKPPAQSESSGQPLESLSTNSKSGINPRHLFETFVVGSSNRFSHAAAAAVADMPGQAYNPLFIYSGVGLGKTHLLGAIGNAILHKAPNTVVRYQSCEKFTNEVINAIREKKTTELRKKYRQIDLLLMDDIQFLEGKESTQEEFFHTFNHLRDAGKQIVLSSDRPPKALDRLAERLRSRFEWGLIADIQPPDYEMRLAILREKAESEKLLVQDFVLEYIASTFTSNIRELEGALLRAHAYVGLTGDSLTPSSLSQILQPGVPRKEQKAVTVETIIDTVASYYKIEPADLRSSRRSQDLTVPRHVAMYLAHEIMSLSYPRIGQAFGNRKHSSAIYAYDKVRTALSAEPAVADAVREITRRLND
jgi:chromosomal replication initiator protein